MGLRDWLEQLRDNLVQEGRTIPRPPLEEGTPSEAVDERQQRIMELYGRLAGDVSPDPGERDAGQQARWLLANLLDWHRREKKAAWWEYFRLCALPPEEFLEEKAGLGGLKFAGRIGAVGRSVIDRYRFPPQESEIRAGDELRDSGGSPFGKVEAIDPAACSVDIRKGPSIADTHPEAVFRHTMVRDDVKRDALMRLGRWVAENGIDGPGQFRAARDLLLRSLPRPGAEVVGKDGALAAARSWVESLDHSVLPIQGPPGAGKTHTGACMITALVRANKRVGIVALSHKVIRNLLEKVVEIAESERTAVRCRAPQFPSLAEAYKYTLVMTSARLYPSWMKAMQQSAAVRIQVLLSRTEAERFDGYCRERGFKKSTLIGRLIREHLEREGFPEQPALFSALPKGRKPGA